MKDDILQHQPDWRYCRVRAGEKKPYPANWQHTPLLLEQVDSENIGLILGPLGNGVCAIDFDGTTAWSWATDNGIMLSELQSVAWTSGKTDRCQMAFAVPSEYWDVLKTRKITTKPASAPGAGDGEGFEFRWAGGQSVLPPSIHPGTGKPYEWVIPATETLQTIPDSVLLCWLTELSRQPAQVLDTTPEVTVDDLTEFEVNEATSVLEILKTRRPILSYDEWRTVCWGLAHHVGRGPAHILITTYYPEQSTGEYNRLLRSWNKAKSPTLGSLMFMAGLKDKK